jgi:hypothetical protein
MAAILGRRRGIAKRIDVPVGHLGSLGTLDRACPRRSKPGPFPVGRGETQLPRSSRNARTARSRRDFIVTTTDDRRARAHCGKRYSMRTGCQVWTQLRSNIDPPGQKMINGLSPYPRSAIRS